MVLCWEGTQSLSGAGFAEVPGTRNNCDRQHLLGFDVEMEDPAAEIRFVHVADSWKRWILQYHRLLSSHWSGSLSISTVPWSRESGKIFWLEVLNHQIMSRLTSIPMLLLSGLVTGN